ncbi:MAG: gephyrin-like molybdotransferase Glp [Anaerolineales bacterium]
MISYTEALERTLAAVSPLEACEVSLADLVGRVAAVDICAAMDSPSVDVSLKDGFALRSQDVRLASEDQPVRLRLLGRAAAGSAWSGEILPGSAVRILTGAPIPTGATAVLAEEFALVQGEAVLARAVAEPGRNIMPRASDIFTGQVLAGQGQVLEPERIGLLAAAGFQKVPVIERVRVGILATGDEVVAPGISLQEGQLYASNLVALSAWCRQYGMQVSSAVARDQLDSLQEALEALLGHHDAILTSGGAWKGDRDLIVHALDRMGWQKMYHRVRIGPGKAAGFGVLGGKPVFILPGGPPSNQMAFLQLALPGLLKMSGYAHPSLPHLPVCLQHELRGQIDWTQFVYGRLSRDDGPLVFSKVDMPSRLQMMAQADSIVSIPEGIDHIPAGSTCEAQLLSRSPAGSPSSANAARSRE